MKKWVQGAWKHLVIWGVLIIYLLSANSLFVRFWLHNGKPTEEKVVLPTETKRKIFFAFRSLTPLLYQGEDLYELNGYAFSKTVGEQGNFKIRIVLHSAAQDLVFDTEPWSRPDVTKAYQEKYKKNLDASGFKVRLSKYVLNPGNYEIGILLEDQQSSTRYYMLTGCYINRQPNALIFDNTP